MGLRGWEAGLTQSNPVVAEVEAREDDLPQAELGPEGREEAHGQNAEDVDEHDHERALYEVEPEYRDR